MKKLLTILSLLFVSLSFGQVITLSQSNPVYQTPNAWPGGNSWNMLAAPYNDMVSLNNSAASLAGNNTFSGTNKFNGLTTINAGVVPFQTISYPYAFDSTGTITAAKVLRGVITCTSGAATTITLPTAAQLYAAGSFAVGTYFDFILDNSQGGSTVTIAGGTGVAAITSPITGGATLTISTVNKVGVFRIYFTSSTTAVLLRLA